MSQTGNRFLLLEQNAHARALAFCVQSMTPRSGGGIGYSASILRDNAPNGLAYPAITPTPMSFRGRHILGQKFTTSQANVVSYSTSAVPYIYTSAGDFTGDFAILLLGNPVSGATYQRWFHQGHTDFGPTSNVALMGNFSVASNTTVAGTVTFFEYNGSAYNGYVDSTASVIDGNPHCFVFTRTAGVHKIFRDGINVSGAQVTSLNVSIGGNNPASVFIVAGGAATSSENLDANCNMPLFAAWNRQMCDAEAVLLSNDPFRLFRTRSFMPSILKAAVRGHSWGGIFG